MTKKFIMLSIIIYSGLIFFTFPSYALKTPKENKLTEASVKSSYGKLPLSFIENIGQVDKSVSYYLKGKQGSVYFTKEAIVYNLFFNKGSNHTERRLDETVAQKRMGTSRRISFSLRPAGANSKLELVSNNILPGRVNYFIGNDPNKWHTDVPIYREILYKDLYNGIDLKIYGTNNRMEYDFIVSPGADPGDIAIECEGVDGLKIDEKGDLLIETSLGNIRHLKPLIYQKIKGERHTVKGSFRLTKNTFAFDIKNYNKDYPLIIDPLTMTYSTFLGGSELDQGESIAVDSAGNAYVVGITGSTDFPTKNAFEETFSGDTSAFVTKINQSGDGLIYSTFIGGNAAVRAWDVAVDTSGSAYITGVTNSDNFPVKDAYQSQISGESDAFVIKLTPAGDSISFSTYLGGSLSDDGTSIAVDSSGNSYITGTTVSTNFPTANAYQSALKGVSDAYIAKLNSTGSGLIFSTYIGGSLRDISYSIAIDSNGNAFITGETKSTDFPVKSSYQNELSGKIDAFVTKVSPSGNSISYSTFLGGEEGDDIANGIDVDDEGNAYIVGQTNSEDFPVKNAYQQVKSGLIDAFITKIKPDGNSIVYSTFLGGGFGDEYGWDMTVDESGCVYVCGYTDSSDFPVKNELQGRAGIYKNAFVTKMNPEGDSLAFSTYIGGTAADQAAHGIAVDSHGSVYITGRTNSTDFPLKDSFQSNYGGSWDVFISKLAMREKYIWHVDGNVATSGDGRSWESALKTIQDAFEVNVASGGDEIWVKRGTYTLSSPIFVSLNVDIYGGFEGGETKRDQRDWRRNITKIDGNYSVHHCFYILASATIDGFTITGGNATGEPELLNDSGGGVFIYKAAPTIANCSIIDNLAGGGAGIFNYFYSSPVITNCTIARNSSGDGGGGIFNEAGSSPIITNSIITGNSADNAGGGGIWNLGYSSPVITNCIIEGNIATNGASGIWNQDDSYPAITNSIIWGNTDEPQMYSDETSTPTVTYCDFQGGFSGEGNIDSDPLFADPAQGNYHLQKSSPCIDKGNNSAMELPDTDFDGNPRIIDGDNDGLAKADMGADEYSTADGDVAPLGNRDGIVNVGDALIALRFALDLETPTEEDKKHGDVAPLDAQGQPNPDGQINVGDALVILRIALGIISLGY